MNPNESTFGQYRSIGKKKYIRRKQTAYDIEKRNGCVPFVQDL